MKYIHPFPARMAPEIIQEKIKCLPENSVILDPMCGSGMVLHHCANAGIAAIGSDTDPLARMISKVSSMKINRKKVMEMNSRLSRFLRAAKNTHVDWIDGDPETKRFVDYWFGRKQQNKLRLFARFFQKNGNCKEMAVLKIALSRLIISKTPKASLASDTSHSRPHKTLELNPFEVLPEFENSLEYVLKIINGYKLAKNSAVYAADARKVKFASNDSVDVIITSPPYLNAIDYIRAHKFSLVWLGYTISELRNIRSSNIGAEAKFEHAQEDFESLLSTLNLVKLNSRYKSIVSRYYSDLYMHLLEAARVLKPGGRAIYVIGNSNIYGLNVRNSEILKQAALNAGFHFVSETQRKLPENRRYLPVAISNTNDLSKRMKEEHIIEFSI